MDFTPEMIAARERMEKLLDSVYDAPFNSAERAALDDEYTKESDRLCVEHPTWPALVTDPDMAQVYSDASKDVNGFRDRTLWTRAEMRERFKSLVEKEIRP